MIDQIAIVMLRLKAKQKIEVVTEGSCMEPIINNGDIVEISASDSYKIGDVVLVLCQGHLKIHRIIEQDELGFITKGDHSYLSDKRNNSRILGVATFNRTQNHLVCANRRRACCRAVISKFASKAYRKHLKSHALIRKVFLGIYETADFMLFYI